MKEYEARCLVEQWVRDYSPFKAEVVNVRPGNDGAWIVIIECNTTLSPTSSDSGEKSAVYGKDERSH